MSGRWSRADAADVAILVVLAFWLVLTLAVGAGAQDTRTAPKRSHAEQRCDKLNANLLPSGWAVITLPENIWREFKVIHGFGDDVQTAVTFPDRQTTYVRESYAITAPETRLRHTLAHEAGHVACRCASEDVANQWAHEHEGGGWGKVKPGKTKTFVLW